MEDVDLNSIFETIDRNHLCTPFEVASYYDINVKFAPFPRSVYGLSEPCSKTIFINESCTENKYFVCGHEVIHSILDDDSAPMLNISYVTNSKIEHRADVGSYYMLYKMIQSELDYGCSSITVNWFMGRFNINAKYYYEVEDFFNSYLTK